MGTTELKLEISLDKSDLKELIRNHLEALHPTFKVYKIHFNITDEYDKNDWRTAYSPTCVLKDVSITMVPK